MPMTMLTLIATIAVGGLTVILTMKEADVHTVRTALMFKVWGLCLLFTVPIGVIEYFFHGAR